MPKIVGFLGYVPVTYENVTIGGRIKNYRIAHGLSHKKLGKILGVDGATISTWETGLFKPAGENLSRLLELLNHEP